MTSDARIVDAAGELAFPLSFAQERLWFLDRFLGEASAYNLPVGWRLRGVLDVSVLEGSLREIARRHDVLRSVFPDVVGRAVQVVRGLEGFGLEVVDLSGLGEREREAEASRLGGEEARRPLDLGRGPVWRARLFRLGERDHVLVVTMHHIVSDAWSVDLFLRELGAIYGAYLEGKGSPLPELPIQYADFALWQREWLTGEVLKEQLSYWRGHLGGGVPVLDLPTDRPRPAVQSFRGGVETAVYPAEVLGALRELSRAEGVTLFMTLLAAFQVLLFRYTGQREVVVGSPIAGRNRVELEGLIGFFVNTLVMRGDFSGDPTFREFLGRVREVALGAYAHQDLPFERLVEELQPERSLSHTPLFQVMFQLQTASGRGLELGGLRIESFRLGMGSAKFDLTFSMRAGADRLNGALEYAADLFDAETVRRMLGHFQRLLGGIVENPDERVSRLPLLSEGERRQVVVEWNSTSVEYPRGETVHGLFEAQAQRTPEAVAVEFEEQSLSYGELNRRANQLAHHLRSLGVGPEVLVGVCLERSLEMVVALLAILKAGGAYVPLDPAYPKERLAFMLEDTHAPVLLTQQTLLDKLPPTSTRMLCVDREWTTVAQNDTHDPRASGTPQNLAYVIYTSGSTGTPKGVGVAQGSVVNLLRALRDQIGWSPKDRSLFVTPLSFDIAALEIFLPLSVGASLHVVSRDAAADPAQLDRTLAAARAQAMQATPTTWRMLLDGAWNGDSKLKALCGGEGLPGGLANQICRRAGTLWNLYGPTETTIWSAAYRVDQPLAEGSLAPIGRPIANTRMHVVSPKGELVPAGVPGELLIGGAGLARGYWRRSDLTAEKFVPDPWSADPGGRLYRTGDLARFRLDGSLEYLGRDDEQVKIRGHRVELGEIEAILREHPGVREAAVVAREDSRGERSLVAYVVPVPDLASGLGALRNFLAEKLPGYMVPSTFVVLEVLPLTPNGKVDRRALPAPEHTRPGLENTFVAPRDPIEEALAGIWAQVLGLERVSVEDDFFSLGGHSLLATQVIARVRDAFGLELPLRALFEAPTVAGLTLAMTQLPPENLGPEEISRSLAEITASAREEKPAADGENR